jgi:tRNA-Thr(GGU) m(6)t(6)A37 methyltransferase TsaA
MEPLVVHPIGIIRTPYSDRASAPRQPNAVTPAEGTIELFNGHNYHHGLEDLESWRYIWVLFWFHLNQGWSPKVLPPRSPKKRGVFSTRSPYRPNPIGLSVVELCGIEGRTLRIRGVDMVDGSPLLDIKPYVPYADAVEANDGWLSASDGFPAGAPIVHYSVEWSDAALAQIRWLEERTALPLRVAIDERLALGPGHYYRRVMIDENGLLLAYRSWRVRATLEGTSIRVSEVFSGYRSADLDDDRVVETRWAEDALALHREYVECFSAARLAPT